MSIALEIQHRSNVMFAELKGLSLYEGQASDLEQKDMQDGMEEKVRRVRTPAGVRRFKKPIGSIIGRGGKVFKNITIEAPLYDGWDLVKDKKGKKYDVGKEGNKWQAYGHNDWDDLVAEADSEDDLYEALDKKVGGAKTAVEKPKAARKKPDQTPVPDGYLDKETIKRKIKEWAAESFGYEGSPRLKNPSERQLNDLARMTPDQFEEFLTRHYEEGEGRPSSIIKSILDKPASTPEPVKKNPKSTDHTGGKRNERSKRPINVRTADDEEQNAQRQSASKKRKMPNRYELDGLAASYKLDGEEVGALKVTLAKNPNLSWSDAALRVAKTGNAIRAALRSDRNLKYPAIPRSRIKGASDTWRALDDKERLELVKISGRGGRLNTYYEARSTGSSHEEAVMVAKGEEVAVGGLPRNAPGTTRTSGRQRAQKIANDTQGANKPKAERTDAEIERGLNNAFAEQFNTLSSSQKRKYFQAFREGKTHSEAMSAARGGSGKAQGALF